MLSPTNSVSVEERFSSKTKERLLLDEILENHQEKVDDIPELISIFLALEDTIYQALLAQDMELPKKKLDAVVKVCSKIIIDKVVETRKSIQRISAFETKTETKNNDFEKQLDTFGLPLHPLEIEIENMIRRAEAGEDVLPDYDRKIYETPVKYLEIELGKYLNTFNGDQGDYLYFFQLRQLNKGFYQTLAKYFERHPEHKYYVPNKSDFVNKEAKTVQNQQLYNEQLHKKFESLKKNHKI